MTSQPSSAKTDKPSAMETAIGYLNFSSGSCDPKFLAAMNELYVDAASQTAPAEAVWRRWGRILEEGIKSIASSGSALGSCEQARAVTQCVIESVLPAYREFHTQLLQHQSDDAIFTPLFLGKVCEAVLAQGGPWDEGERITGGALRMLNDYVGYRPVPTLQTHKHEPYDHEWIRPIPLYIDGAGVSAGRYHDVVEVALGIVRQTDEQLLRAAFLNPDWLEELAFDPRAYDFDHPANKRPNHHFGQWDPHYIDNSGRYRRLVVQQVTLDALMDRVENPPGIAPEEALWEGGAVLAGVMLMATGICGWGPEALDSTIHLGNLLPHIAAYRDAFYEQLLAKREGNHGERLREEAKQKRQPFAGARQQLNASLTSRRSTQVGHVQLARLFARMGYPEASQRHADVVPSAAARISCRIDCALDNAKRHIAQLQLETATDDLGEAEDWLRKGIECGAIVDPWTILGFDANFSLFPAMENSIRDIRADELAELMDLMFQRYTSLWCAAAATNEATLVPRIARQMQDLTGWWHQFAAHEVSSLDAPNGELAYEAARHVADILQQWHAAGAAGGDIRFWAPHAQLFETPKAYATVIEALLDRGDYVASKALLVHWLSRAEEAGLEQGESRFASLALRWLSQLQQDERFADDEGGRWELMRHLFDMFEVNAEEYGQAPQFLLGKPTNGNGQHEDPFDDPIEDDEDDIYGAAYEEVVYRDTTDDGFEGDIFDYGQPSEGELEAEAKRIGLQLGYLTALAQLWKSAAWGTSDSAGQQQRDSLLSWFRQADGILQGLRRLASEVAEHRIASGGLDCEANVEFDRQKSLQEALLERIAMANVDVADAALFVLAAASAAEERIGNDWDWPVVLSDEGRLAVSLIAALQRGDALEAKARCSEYIEAIESLPLLYVPISRGGDPHEFVLVRRRQKTLQNLAFLMPRAGLLSETRRIVETARRMERDHPVGPGAVTEFDSLFEVAYRAIIDCVLHSSRSWYQDADEIDETTIFALLEHITRPMNEIWDGHSRTLRLSVLERAGDEKIWTQLVRFIRTYGSDLFTQHFLNLGNIRAIQHRGVDQWLDEMVESGQPELPKLFDDLGGRLSRRRAVRCLSLILDAIAENYFEYRDYNATRTESDRGEELYKLLDFLRLRVDYDTVAWRYRPVIIAHELVLQRHRQQLAELFRRGLGKCTREQADHFQWRLEELQNEHAMLMPTIAEKIAERFIQPTAIHRACSLIEPSMRDCQCPQNSSCFEMLEQEAETMVEECGGVGLDIPPWLITLEEEVDRVRRPAFERDEHDLLAEVLPQTALTQEQLEELLNDWSD